MATATTTTTAAEQSLDDVRPCSCAGRRLGVAIFVRVSTQRGWAYAEARCTHCLRATPRTRGRTPLLAQISAFDAWQRGWIELPPCV